MTTDQATPASQEEPGPATGAGNLGLGPAGPGPAVGMGEGQAAAARPSPAAVRGSKGRHAGPALSGPAPAALLPAPAGAARRLLTWARSSPLAAAGLVILIAMTVFCFIGPLLYHTDQVHVFLRQANLSPRAGHPFGTDDDGDDELGRLMVAGQVSLEVGVAAGLLAAILGSLWGAIAGYVGGVADAIMMRIVDAGVAIPTIVVALILVSIYRPSEPVLVLVIAATSWLSTARLVRAEALTLRAREFVQVVRVMGGGSLRAVLGHIGPNALGTIAVSVTFQVGNAILALATLSYLGLGIQFPSVDWGDMTYSAVVTISLGYWWQIVAPGAAIMLTVVAFTMVGDGLRDSFRSDVRRGR
jgi:peptide/nickel transport system permease protein